MSDGGLPNARWVPGDGPDPSPPPKAKEKPYAIQRIEKRERETVFWCGRGEGGEQEFGIVLTGRDGFSEAHSILMAIDIGAKVIMDFCNEKESPQ